MGSDKTNKQQAGDKKDYNQIHWYIINNDLQNKAWTKTLHFIDVIFQHIF